MKTLLPILVALSLTGCAHTPKERVILLRPDGRPQTVSARAGSTISVHRVGSFTTVVVQAAPEEARLAIAYGLAEIDAASR